MVCLVENSAENREKIEAAAGSQRIEYREAEHTAGELYDFRLALDALWRRGRLPHVAGVLETVDPREGRVCVVLDEVSQESLDELRRYDPDLTRTKVLWYSASALVAE